MWHLRNVVIFLLTVSLAACGGAGQSIPTTAGSVNSAALQIAQGRTAPARASAIARNASAPDAVPATVRIDAGGAADGSWSADAGYNGGQTAVVGNAIATSGVSNPAPVSVYQSQRYATNLIYTVPHLAANSAYTVRLHFVESWFSTAGMRIFDGYINGVKVLSNFDIFAAAGGANVALAKSFAATADANGNVTIRLVASVNNATIAAIELLPVTATPTPVPSATPTPVPTATPTAVATAIPAVQIDAGGGPSGSWKTDVGYSGGQTMLVANVIDTSHVAQPAPQGVYQSQRYATNLSYKVSSLTANASYTVRLHFVESWFTGPGQRVFNGFINGTQVLTNFDIFAAAGGANVAIVKAFGATADGTGSINVAFTATVNNASIAGLEVIASAGSASPSPTPTASPSPTATPSPVPSPTSSPFGVPSKVMSGVVTNSLPGWNAWLGHPTQLVGVYNDIGASSWSSLDDIVWMVSTYPAGTPMIWSLASYPTSSSLAAVAQGAGNGYYAQWAAQILANAAPAPDGNYYIRPNWEAPAAWFSWGGQCSASPANCIAAYQQIAAVFHAASPKFKMVWDTIPVYGVTTDNAVYYPGDSYVDVLSQDLYLDTSGTNSPAGMWSYGLQRPNGLNWLTTFAAAHNKRIAMTEWGVNSNTAGPLITDIENWLAANHAVYQIYFDSGNTQLSNNQYPASGQVLKPYF